MTVGAHDDVPSDAELLAAMIDHYANTLAGSEPARDWLVAHAISTETARRLRVGFSDRTFGNAVPRSTLEQGRAIRKRLGSLRVTLPSGHEKFRGCVTVPVTDRQGETTALYGIRICASLPAACPRELWLELAGESMSASMFNAAHLGSPEAVVASSIPIALALITGGIEAVVAPGSPDGLGEGDVDAILGCTRRLVVVTRSKSDTALTAAFSAHGITPLTVNCRPLGTLAARVADALGSQRSALANLASVDTVDNVIPQPKKEALQAASPEVDVGASESAAVSAMPSESEIVQAPSFAEYLGPEVDAAANDWHEVRIETQSRSWRIRGVTRSKGYEVLRANVMVTDMATGRFHVDTIDLYSSRQRGGFVASCAEELNVAVPVIAAEIGKALLACEQAADRAASKPGLEPVAMSAAECQEAMAMLVDPTLVDTIVADIAALGLIGEEDNALLAYLALVSRTSERPLSVMVQSSPSAGKSTLADAVTSLMPPEDVVAYSALTGQALYYLGTGDLAHKVLCVAEEEGPSKATYAIKLLVSSGKLAIASTGKDAETAKLVTKTYEVAGPVSLLMTTTSPMVDEELASRLVAISVAESVSQTRAIHVAQRAGYSAAGLVAKHGREAILARHHNAQRLLQPLPVVIASVEALTFADATTRSRRDHDKYLSLIATSALLHQFQREVKSIEVNGQAISYIEATPDDVALADRLAQGVIVRDSSDLPPATASLLALLASWAGTEPFTRRGAREALGLGDTQLKVHLARLVELEYALCVHAGRTVSYQLAWSAPGLRSNIGAATNDPIGSAELAIRSGSGRPQVGVRSGSGRGYESGSSSQVSPKKSAPTATKARNRTYGGETDDYPYEVALQSAGRNGWSRP